VLGIICFFVTKCELGGRAYIIWPIPWGIDNAELECQIRFWLRKFTKSERGSEKHPRMNFREDGLSRVPTARGSSPFAPTLSEMAGYCQRSLRDRA